MNIIYILYIYNRCKNNEVQSMTRINCHSAFKHYEMFHSGCGGGNNYGSIFNTTYNIDCNGHGGGFWGGFGFGLGNAFGGLFSGLFGGGMGFGGFGMGGFGFPMFNNFGFGGFGIPSWGGGWFGGGSRVGDDDGSVRRKKASDDGDRDTVEGNKDLECKDPDRQKIVDYGDKVNELLDKKDNLKPDELKTLYNQIKKSLEESKTEGHHDKTDPKDYENWLDVLKDIAERRGWGDIESEDFGKDVTQIDDENETETPENKTGSNPEDLTVDQIKGLTNEEISKLTPEQAKALLEKLGIKDGGVIKDANNISVLLLLEKAGIDVKIAENTDTTSVTDHWIQGKISGVQQDKDGKISYSVDCTAHGSQKNKYNFNQKSKDSPLYTVTVKEFGEGARYAKDDVKSVEYEYDSASGHLKRNGYKFTTEL